MDLEQIERLLDLLDKKQYQKVSAGLQEERGKIIQMQEHQESVLFQTTMENFFRRKATEDDRYIYCFANGLFTCSNGASIFQIKEELVAFSNPESKDSFLQSPKVKRVDEKEILNLLGKFRKMIEHQKAAVEYQQIVPQSGIVIYESCGIEHSFSLQQIEYMKTFLGENIEIYMSKGNPIAYGESDLGKGYVLGMRN